MVEDASGKGIPPEDAAFAQLVVSQGIARREQVEECLDTLRRLIDGGITPLPTLGQLLVQKGFLDSSRLDRTLKASDASGPSRTVGPLSSGPGAVPGEVTEAASRPENRFGKYVILNQIGQGGFGAVYRAWQLDLGRLVALKFLHSQDDGDIQRFLREAQTAAPLSHPHIVPIYEAGEHDGKVYLAMEFIEGQTLNRIRLDPRRAAEVLRDAASALHYAHQQGVIHRDLKPQNMMMGPDGRVRVMDFGLARQLKGGTTLTLAGAVVGTPSYMPPEQARGRACDERSDVYSLGATLYELLTGRPPFLGQSILEVLQAVAHDDPVAPRKLMPALTLDLETICLKCLEKDPPRRYPDARALAADLEAWLRGDPVDARPPRLLERAQRHVRRRPARYGVAAVLTAAILAVGIWYGTRPGRLDVAFTTPGAAAFLDGNPAPLQDGRLLRTLSAGRHVLRVEAPGHHPLEENLIVGRLATDRREITLRAVTGFLQLAADQPDVKVTLLDPAGTAVLRDVAGQALEALTLPAVVELREGPCRIRAEKLGFHLPEERIDVPGGKGTLRWTGRLRDDRASLIVGCRQTQVQAVFERQGEVPFKAGPLTLPLGPDNPLRLPEGTYRASFRSDLLNQPLWERRSTIVVEAGRKERRFVELEGQVLWSFKTEGDRSQSQSAPAVGDVDGDGTLDCVFGSEDRRVYALSGWDGRKLWSFETGARIFSSPALGDLDGDGALDVVAGSDDGTVTAISGRSGRPLWSVETRGWIRSSPCLADLDGDAVPDVVTGSNDGGVHAVSGKSGKRLWVFETGQPVGSSAAAGDLDGDGAVDVAIGSADGALYALEGRSGRLLWKHQTKGVVESGVALADLDRDGGADAVAGSNDGWVYAVSGKSGRLLWSFETGRKVQGGAVLVDLDADGVADCVVESFDSHLYAISGKDGRLLWKFKSNGWKGFTPAMGDLDGDAVPDFAIGGYSDFLHAISGRDGSELWSLKLSRFPSADLALADLDGDGHAELIVRTNDDVTRAFTVKGDLHRWSIQTDDNPSMAALGDLDGDSVPDAVLTSGWNGPGTALAVSGKDGRELWSAALGSAPTPGGPSLGDLDGDGTPEALFSVRGNPMCSALSAKDGRPHWESGKGKYGRPLTPVLSDLDGDGRWDALIAGSIMDGLNNFKSGWVQAHAGKDGRILWSFDAGAGFDVPPALGDLDGDGTIDGVLGDKAGRILAFSGKDGRELWSFSTGGEAYLAQGLEDLDGDAVPDVGAASDAGKVYALSGRDGRILWSAAVRGWIDGPPVWMEADGDGIPDCALTASGKAYVVGGKDGRVLWTAPIRGKGMPALARGDLDGDSLQDLVFLSGGSALEALSGKDGRRLWTCRTKDGERHLTGLADLDGDGRPEVIYQTESNLMHARRGTAWKPGPSPVWSRGHRARLDRIGKAELPPVVCKPGEIVWQRGATPGRKAETGGRRDAWEAARERRGIGEADRLRAEGRVKEALAAVERERGAEALRVQALCRGQLKDYGAARTAWETAVGLAPQDVDLLDAAAWFLLNCPDEKGRDPVRALEWASRSCDLTKRRDWGMLDTLALALSQAGRTAESVDAQRHARALMLEQRGPPPTRSFLEHAARLEPESGAVRRLLARSLLYSRDAGERDDGAALVQARRANELTGGAHVPTLTMLAVALERNGRVEEEVDALFRILRHIGTGDAELYRRELGKLLKGVPAAPEGAAIDVGMAELLPVGKVVVEASKDRLGILNNGMVAAAVSIPANGLYEIRVVASGGKVKGQFPRFRVRVDDGGVGTVDLASAGPAEYRLEAPIPAGARTLAVEFLNDDNDPAAKADRNVYLHALSLRRLK